MKDDTHVKEKEERKVLAKKITETNERFARTIDHTKWWHRSVVIPRKVGFILLYKREMEKDGWAKSLCITTSDIIFTNLHSTNISLRGLGPLILLMHQTREYFKYSLIKF